jgi:hypothetical protein
VTSKWPQRPSKTSQNGPQEHQKWPLSPLTLVNGTQWHPMWTQWFPRSTQRPQKHSQMEPKGY